MGDQITISSGTGLSDTLVQLEPIEVTEENAYDEPAYLTPGMPVEMDAEKGAWFKIGVDAGRNESEVDKVISVYVKGVKVRTPDIVKIIFEATVLEINDTCYLDPPEQAPAPGGPDPHRSRRVRRQRGDGVPGGAHQARGRQAHERGRGDLADEPAGPRLLCLPQHGRRHQHRLPPEGRRLRSAGDRRRGGIRTNRPKTAKVP